MILATPLRLTATPGQAENTEVTENKLKMEEIRNRHNVTIFLLAIFAVSTVSFGEENLHLERAKTANESSCLLEGTNEYSIHLFRGGLRSCTDGYVIAHISYKTNKITWLYISGVCEEPTRRVSFSIKKIRGILVHKSYLYILVYELHRCTYDERPDQSVYLQNITRLGHFKMLVFNNENGEQVGYYPFNDLIYTPPSIDLFCSSYDNLGHGPIFVSGKGVECFGVIFTIEGKKLVFTPLVPDVNADSLIFSIKDINVNLPIKRITLSLEFKTEKNPVMFDTYFPEYHISFNGRPFINLGPIKWRHPFTGNDLKTINFESPYIMTYYYDVPLGIEEIRTIRMRVIRRDKNEELVKVLERIGHQNPDLYKNAWFGQATSQEFIVKPVNDPNINLNAPAMGHKKE
jgi:hypothetical protein